MLLGPDGLCGEDNSMWVFRFFYLVAIMDWHTRKVLAQRTSNTLEADDFCVKALKEAIGYLSPAEAEEVFYANLNSLDMVA